MHARDRLVGLLVWAGTAANVDTVFVDGKKLLENGRSLIWDEEQVIRDAGKVMADIVAETGIDAMMSDRSPGNSFRGWTYL
jgi:hypothetical protein